MLAEHLLTHRHTHTERERERDTHTHTHTHTHTQHTHTHTHIYIYIYIYIYDYGLCGTTGVYRNYSRYKHVARLVLWLLSGVCGSTCTCDSSQHCVARLVRMIFSQECCGTTCTSDCRQDCVAQLVHATVLGILWHDLVHVTAQDCVARLVPVTALGTVWYELYMWLLSGLCRSTCTCEFFSGLWGSTCTCDCSQDCVARLVRVIFLRNVCGTTCIFDEGGLVSNTLDHVQHDGSHPALMGYVALL